MKVENTTIPMSDEIRIENILNGDINEYKYLVEEYQSMVLNLSYKYTGNWEDSNDLSQEIFIRAYNNLSKFRKDSSFKTWLYRIAVNTLLTFKSRKRNIQIHSFEEYQDIQDNSKDSNPEFVFNRKVFNSSLSKAFNKIKSAKIRIALILRFTYHLSIKEIAEIMNLKEGTIKTLLHRGVKYLKKDFNELQEALYEID